MRKIFYGLAILFGILLIGSFSIQESFAEFYIDKDYPKND